MAQNEVDILKKLKGHANIVQFFGECKSQRSHFCLVFEFHPYDLITLINIKDSKFEKKEIVYIVSELLSALEVLSKFQLMHRDIKPHNVLVSVTGKVVLADLGQCRLVEKSGNFTTEVGTVPYMAPELCVENKGYDEKIDMWSFGCLLAELLMRKPLFPGKNTRQQQLQLIQRFQCSVPETHCQDVKKRESIKNKCIDEAGDAAWQLLESLLTTDPRNRASLVVAKESDFFLDNSSISDHILIKTVDGKIELSVPIPSTC